jgi:hypothetical protein
MPRPEQYTHSKVTPLEKNDLSCCLRKVKKWNQKTNCVLPAEHSNDIFTYVTTVANAEHVVMLSCTNNAALRASLLITARNVLQMFLFFDATQGNFGRNYHG